MPNTINPKTFATIVLLTITKDATGFIVQIPEALLAVAQQKAVIFGTNLLVQGGTGGTIAAGSVIKGAPDPMAPVNLIKDGWYYLESAETVRQMHERGTVSAALLIISGVSAESPNASAAFGALLLALQALLPPGAQSIVRHSRRIGYSVVVCRAFVRLVTEIKSPEFSIFKRKKIARDFKMKILRFKKTNRKIPGFKNRNFLSSLVDIIKNVCLNSKKTCAKN